jgi:hypothetical protein
MGRQQTALHGDEGGALSTGATLLFRPRIAPGVNLAPDDAVEPWLPM